MFKIICLIWGVIGLGVFLFLAFIDSKKGFTEEWTENRACALVMFFLLTFPIAYCITELIKEIR